MSERPRRITGLQVVAMLRSIDEDDSGEESEPEEGSVVDWELYSLYKMSDYEKTEQFDDTQPVVHVGDLQTAYTNVGDHSATCFDNDSGSGAAESSSTHETARDGTKWEFMKFGVEAQVRRGAQNVLTKQSGFALRKADSPPSAFQVIFDDLMFKHIQKCTNVEHQRIFEFHFVSSMHLWHCYMYEMRMGQKLSPLQFLD